MSGETRADALSESKRAMRKRMESLLSGLRESELVREGRAAAAALSGSEKWIEARTVLCFLSMGGEIGTGALLEAAFAAGKAVAMPVVAGGDIVFRYADGLDLAWNRGPFGIREPPASCRQAVPADLEGPVLVVVPGVAFDASGGRLGHGKGFYDRFLKSLRLIRADSYAVGFCLGSQIVGSVPMSDHDERLDALCSSGGFSPSRA
ncbi:MAG TPA: 5-formyltetrahydrofolate cyclo-ligase [Treponema sp.]|nr:MAG: 5-formyltetrahydrofolate cyclo-ligase [Treponema sp. GWA1_62_8]OHE64228.1 MAG: 5-formyltetrahydrofolate cyclo-ligase [Treponema sp. GWC1_61_84]HCM26372.1 5-formyltetrahydrofolate cyclo-ligase [Treponema sp.]